MTPSTIRLISTAVGAGLLLALLVLGYRSWKTGQDAKDDLDQAQRTDQAASGIVTDINSGQSDAAKVDITVTDARSEYYRGYQDAKREDPAVADLASTPIPQRLRDLARQRREARERSGRVGPGGEDDAADP